MNLSVRQLLLNHARGIDSKVHMYPEQYFDTPIPIIQDRTDLDNFKEANKRQLDLFNDSVKEERAAQAAQLQNEEKKKDVEDLSKKNPDEPITGD